MLACILKQCRRVCSSSERSDLQCCAFMMSNRPGTRSQQKNENSENDSINSVPISSESLAFPDLQNIIRDTLSMPDVFDNLVKNIATILHKKFEAEFSAMKEKVAVLEAKLASSETQRDAVMIKMDKLEQYSRRNNIRIFGVAETVGENTDDIVMQICARNLQTQIDINDIDRSHRVGRIKPNDTRPRPIIVKFTNYHVRSKVFNNKKLLKGTGYTIREDLSLSNVNIMKSAILKYGSSSVWSRDGFIFARHNNKVIRLN